LYCACSDAREIHKAKAEKQKAATEILKTKGELTLDVSVVGFLRNSKIVKNTFYSYCFSISEVV